MHRGSTKILILIQNYYFRTDGVKVDITIDDFFIKNLATFETKIVHVDIEGLTLALELMIPKLRVSKLKMVPSRV